MAEFWLSDGNTTIELDDNINTMDIGGNSRKWKVTAYAGANGGFINGSGGYSSKKIKVSRREKAGATDITAWNQARADFMTLFTQPKLKEVFLYQSFYNGITTQTIKTRVYTTSIPGDSYSFFKVSNSRVFELISPSGVWESETETVIDNDLDGAGEQVVNYTFDTLIETPPVIKWTPLYSGQLSFFRVITETGEGFSITFDAPKGIFIYDTKNNKFYLGSIEPGNEVPSTAFAFVGSPFQLSPGNSTLRINCDGPFNFELKYNGRYV